MNLYQSMTRRKKDLDKLIQDKQAQVKSLDKKIEKLEHIKIFQRSQEEDIRTSVDRVLSALF